MIFLGTAPYGLLAATDVTDVTGPASAQELILRALNRTGAPLSWQLLCDPVQCALNLHVVPERQ